MGSLKDCMFRNDEEDRKQISSSNLRKSKLEESKNKNLKETKLINTMNSSIFKNPYYEMIKHNGKVITLQEFENKIPSEYSEDEKKNPYDLDQYSNNEELIPEKPLIFNNNNIYYGNWNKELKISGTGKMLLNQEKIYSIGIWKNGIFYKGRIYFPNGIYEGEVNNKTFNGKGILKYKNGDIYEGDFENGIKKGNGKMIFIKNNIEYIGGFNNGEINGKGKMTFDNGIYYKGDFINGKFEGKGLLSNINNEWSYNGEFKYGYINGYGKFIFTNGDLYEGNYLYNIKNGEGNYVFKNGNSFNGTWKNNSPEEGKFIINNIIYKCVFRNGKLYDKEIENGNDNYNDYIDLNNIQFQKEEDDKQLKFIFELNCNSFGNSYLND